MISDVDSLQQQERRGAPSIAPGPKGYPILGALPKVMKDPLQVLSRMVRDYGDVVCLGGFGSQKFYLVTHPRDVEHVWKTHHRNYVKGANFQLLRPLAGNGLFLNEGDSWRTQRKLLQPAFHLPRLIGMADTITASTAAMLERWRRDILPGEPFDLEHEMMDVLVEISTQTLFGSDVAGDSATVHQAITTAFSILHRRVLSPLPLPWWVPFPDHVRFLKAVASLEAVVYRIIAERRASGVEGNDVLSTLLSVRDEAGDPMPDQQIRDEVITMLVAGHESTGTSLAWTLWLLSRYPVVAQRVNEELMEVLGGRISGPTRRRSILSASRRSARRAGRSSPTTPWAAARGSASAPGWRRCSPCWCWPRCCSATTSTPCRDSGWSRRPCCRCGPRAGCG